MAVSNFTRFLGMAWRLLAAVGMLAQPVDVMGKILRVGFFDVRN